MMKNTLAKLVDYQLQITKYLLIFQYVLFYTENLQLVIAYEN